MRLIRVSSKALGPRLVVKVHIYDTVQELRDAAEAFNGTEHGDAVGVTQVWADENGRAGSVIVRLARPCLGGRVVSHEMHHAATALYGAHVGDRISRRAHLNHHNEPMAHLFSDLLYRLVDRLYALGYYDRPA
jgi:hypothetical protein